MSTVFVVVSHYGEMLDTDMLVPFHTTLEGAQQAALAVCVEYDEDGETLDGDWREVDPTQWPEHIGDSPSCTFRGGLCDENLSYEGTACWILEVGVAL